ncbi:hypothetical protein CUMW_177660, partial [Citrus unshiu]
LRISSFRWSFCKRQNQVQIRARLILYLVIWVWSKTTKDLSFTKLRVWVWTRRFRKPSLFLCLDRVCKAMDAYKRWVRRNRDYVHSLESLANGLTWLLPERFSESEIGPEAGFVKLWVLVRLALFQNSGYKMLLHGGETLNVEMPSDDSKSQLNIRGCPKRKAWRESEA